MPKAAQAYRFTVEGSGEFPFDMLRYDRCWPKDESHDVVNMTSYSRDRFSLRKRQVELIGLNDPTSARWASFGWKIVQFDRISLNVR